MTEIRLADCGADGSTGPQAMPGGGRMIACATPRGQSKTVGNLRYLEKLRERLQLPDDVGDPAAHARFPLRVPTAFLDRIPPGKADDPLLRQILPVSEELLSLPGFGPDPVDDEMAMVVPGVLSKYAGRALLIVTGACAIHCRYCFRREFPYEDANAASDQWSGALRQLQSDTSVREVILSGGDPLSLSDEKLTHLVEQLDAIPHLQRLRLHTRWPVVAPKRVGESLLAWLGATRLKTALVVHVNHPQELDAHTAHALRQLSGVGVCLLNQSVLLRGVNDAADVLVDLSETLFAQGVLPYYLHQLDRAAGTAHFEVSDRKALRLYTALQRRLPGYLVPRLVRETAGAPCKLPLDAVCIRGIQSNR